jgi:nitrogen fixation protein NifQ
MAMTVLTMLDRKVRDGLLVFAGDPANLGVRAIAGVIASGREGRIPALEEGLGSRRFAALVARLFPGADPGESPHPAALFPAVEYGDLMRLLLDHRSRQGEETELVAHATAVACLGANHLWEDMHLDNRAELSALIRAYFGSLAALNVRDMKWKNFFYKQICAREGFVACRAPRCEECCDQDRCFGPEDGSGAGRP